MTPPSRGIRASIKPGAIHSLFMLGMLAIGVALISGIAVRIAAAAGALILAMMWLAESPFAQHTSAGAATGSSNPLVDYHFLYALVLLVLATSYASTTWGLGRIWARLPFVHRHHWAL
jgi:thiosulfate dehydrogenase [quinone] large subunit